ncbi:MAG TPA: hypothetical protein VD766_05145 [Solirubrobacterales bacterium]|nr:hypothetical protein [Solirubrobacterales bacterium]
MFQSRKGRLFGGGLVIVALVGAGLAYAAWTANGTGSGYAKAGSAQALTTNDVSATTVADLYPGSSGNVKVEINNPNPFPVRVTAISGAGTITPDAGHSGCSPTGVTFTNQTGLTIDIAANGTQAATLNNAASMSNASANACQGATFTIPVSLTGASNAP